MDASLVIPVYNNWHYVHRLLGGIDTTSLSALDVVVVDDASTEPGLDALLREFPSVRGIRHDQNGGFAAAVNTGVNASTGDVVLLSNSDIEVDGDVLEKLTALAEKHPLAIFAPATHRVNGEPIQIAHRFPTPFRQTLELHVLFRLLRRAGVASVSRKDWMVGSFLAFHRNVWSLVGELDEGYGMYSEEVDWQVRAAARGVQRVYVPDVFVVHDESQGAGRYTAATERRFFAVWRARVRYFRKHGGRLGILRLRLGWLLASTLNVPTWSLASVVPALRGPALNELRRSRLLVRESARRKPFGQ
ncbi:glycosyltransferase [Modestobacter sp. L9-4]|uniref:glycosyltransferase family 2 protein n=1 Tax=Modestobacter sp. L9-4 TaxID=2851567 RepID=UPI001C7853BF|nr:glycosyltransferase [Modestobacter sp. L9-4]